MSIEALRGKTGYLTLHATAIDSYEREEYLLFSGFDDDGASLDQETMEKLFELLGASGPGCAMHSRRRGQRLGRGSDTPRQRRPSAVA